MMNADDYAKFIESLNLNEDQLKTLENLITDSYVDGWTDGNAHKVSLNPTETHEAIQNDLNDSWAWMIFTIIRMRKNC